MRFRVLPKKPELRIGMFSGDRRGGWFVWKQSVPPFNPDGSGTAFAVSLIEPRVGVRNIQEFSEATGHGKQFSWTYGEIR
jgi:hypothetical protein